MTELSRSLANPEVDEVSLVDLLTILLRRWRRVVGVAFVCMLLAALVVVLQPRRYVVETVLVPAMEKGGSPSVGALMAQLPGGIQSLAGGGASDPKQKLIESVLKSASLHLELIDRIVQRSGAQPEEVSAILRKGTKIQGSLADGSINIQVTSRNPELAVAIANEFPLLGNEISTRLGADLARQKQLLLRTQLDDAAQQLARSEQRILEFQAEQGLPEAEGQARLTMEVAGRLQEMILRKEMEVMQLRRSATPDNPVLRAAVAELGSLREQLSSLSAGRSGDLLIPLDASAELRLRATRLFRDHARDEQIYLALTAALADVQIEAQNSLPVVGVLDPALPPTRPAPRYALLIVTLAGFLGVLLGLIIAFTEEALARLRHQPGHEALVLAWRELGRGMPLRLRRSADAPSRR